MLRSCVDYATRTEIGGWAHDSARPDRPVSLLVTDNGELIDRVLANQFRPDLRQAGVGDGRHGFHLRIPAGLCALSRHVIQVRCESDGGELANSPRVLEPATVFDEAVERGLADLLGSVDSPAALDRRIGFLAAQLDRLLLLRAAPAPDAGPRALVIDERPPQAHRDAGSNAVLSHMRALRRLGFAVTFAAADMAGAELEDAEVCAAPVYPSVEDLLRRHAGRFDLVYLHRLSVAARYSGLVRHHCPRARLIYSVADLHHVRIARQAAAQGRPELLESSRAMRIAEIAAARAADAVITHSTVEARALRSVLPAGRIHVVPWAVRSRPTQVDFADRHGLAFIGGFRHPPNLDAATWLIEEIMPLVWRHDPAITCYLAGSDMPGGLRRMARPGIVPLGHVRDLGRLFDQVRLTVAPLTYGAGIKGKVLESLAAGLPCVTTAIAAEGLGPGMGLGLGLGLGLGEHVADSAAAIAENVYRLHSDAAANAAAGAAGVDLVRSGWSEEQVDAALGKAVKIAALPASFATLR